jgi:hypothetical protein
MTFVAHGTEDQSFRYKVILAVAQFLYNCLITPFISTLTLPSGL